VCVILRVVFSYVKCRSGPYIVGG